MSALSFILTAIPVTAGFIQVLALLVVKDYGYMGSFWRAYLKASKVMYKAAGITCALVFAIFAVILMAGALVHGFNLG